MLGKDAGTSCGRVTSCELSVGYIAVGGYARAKHALPYQIHRATRSTKLTEMEEI